MVAKISKTYRMQDRVIMITFRVLIRMPFTFLCLFSSMMVSSAYQAIFYSWFEKPFLLYDEGLFLYRHLGNFLSVSYGALAGGFHALWLRSILTVEAVKKKKDCFF